MIQLSPFTLQRSDSAATRLGRRAVHGFSLVEIAMAIAIVSFAFVALLGMLPTGISTYKRAMDTTVSAQIAQTITGELQETDFLTLLKATDLDRWKVGDADETGMLDTRYFDDQGTELRVTGTPTPQERARILYEAYTRLKREGILPAMTGKEAGHHRSVSAASVTVQVITNPGGQVLVPDPVTNLIAAGSVSGITVRNFPAVVARNGLVLP